MSSNAFYNGIWEGWFQREGKRTSVCARLNFKKGGFSDEGTVDGNGSDEILGVFQVSGSFLNRAPYRCTLTFNYSSSGNSVECSGWRESDKGGVIGQFSGGIIGKGNICLYPKKDGNYSESAKQMEDVIEKSRKEQLQLMGFPEWLIDQALQETDDVESALNWITSRSEGNADTEEVSDSNVQELQLMGFDEEIARQALLLHQNDIQKAVNWLFDQ